MHRFALFTTATLLCCGVAGHTVADEDHDHEEHSDIELGQLAGGQLGLIGIPDEPIFLEPVSGLINGWSADEPGLFEVEAAEEGVSPLDTFTNLGIRLELILADSGLKVLEAGSLKVVDDEGEFAALGTEAGAVHSHPTWWIDSGVVGGSFEGTLSATFKLVDANGNYGESAPFVLEFTNVPEPGSLALLGLGGLAALRRRR